MTDIAILGGQATAKYGKSYYAELGRLSGMARKKKRDDLAKIQEEVLRNPNGKRSDP